MEEERIKREREELERRLDEEQNKKRRLKDEMDAENKRLKDLAYNMNRPGSKKVEFDLREQNPQETKPSVIVYDPKADEDLKKGIQDHITRLRNQVQEQQMQVINQITELKQETQQANLQRYEALKEISYLKEEISKTRIEDELRRKYVYDVMVDNKHSLDTVMNNTKLEGNDRTSGLIYDQQGFDAQHKKNVKKIVYDDMIRHPKRPPMIPKIVDDGDVDIGGKSSFIDIDTYRMNADTSHYEPAYKSSVNKNNYNDSNNRDNFNREEEFNKKAIKIEDDQYLPLDGFYKGHDEQISNNLNKHYKERTKDYKEIKEFNNNYNRKYDNNNFKNTNKDDNNDGIDKDGEFSYNDKMSVNHIYNKNMERLRWLNNIEELNK